MEAKKKGLCKTGVLLKEVKFIWNFAWQDNKRVTFKYRWPLKICSIHMKFSMTSQEKLTFKYRWLLNRGDHMGRYQCITTPLTHFCHLKYISNHFKLNRVLSSITFKKKKLFFLFDLYYHWRNLWRHFQSFPTNPIHCSVCFLHQTTRFLLTCLDYWTHLQVQETHPTIVKILQYNSVDITL